jgi:Uma2 family endonuclease
MVIEVERTRRTTKLRLYARAGVPEYWVVSVDGEWIEV